jgi:hypothetical protein
MNPEQVRDLLETQRQSLIDEFNKEIKDLNDTFFKLLILYNEMKTDRDILSRRYNELVNQSSLEDAT